MISGIMAAFKDHFSTGSAQYGRYRPDYPPELFQYLASLTSGHDCAWDCATGTGQSAVMLSDYYREVIATDASDKQLQQAVKKQGVSYRVALAEDSGLVSDSIDLITVSQALHWFNIDAFAVEAGRILKPGGVLAVWAYNLMQIRPDIDAAVNHLYGTVLGAYWPPERRLVETGYSEIKLPFREIPVPEFHMQQHWDLDQVAGYLSTWSAVKRYRQDTGADPVAEQYQALAECWGDPQNALLVQWPLAVRFWINEE